VLGHEADALRAKMQKAVKELVAAIYFGDSSDYLPGMYEALFHLDPDMLALLNDSPGEAYELAEAAA
jgi:hypothetical protein